MTNSLLRFLLSRATFIRLQLHLSKQFVPAYVIAAINTPFPTSFSLFFLRQIHIHKSTSLSWESTKQCKPICVQLQLHLCQVLQSADTGHLLTKQSAGQPSPIQQHFGVMNLISLSDIDSKTHSCRGVRIYCGIIISESHGWGNFIMSSQGGFPWIAHYRDEFQNVKFISGLYTFL